MGSYVDTTLHGDEGQKICTFAEMLSKVDKPMILELWGDDEGEFSFRKIKIK